jgi:hypothetical protein
MSEGGISMSTRRLARRIGEYRRACLNCGVVHKSLCSRVVAILRGLGTHYGDKHSQDVEDRRPFIDGDARDEAVGLCVRSF